MEISSDKKDILEKITLGNYYLIKGKAGTGKTVLGVLVGKKLIEMIPNVNKKVLFITYSKLAKWQINETINRLINEKILKKDVKSRFEVSNFHSIWWDLIKNNRFFLGLKKKPTILTKIELEIIRDKFIEFLEIDTNERVPPSFLTKNGTINKNKVDDLRRIIDGVGLLYQQWNPESFGEHGKNFIKQEEFLQGVADKIKARNKDGFFSHDETVYWIKILFENNINVLRLFNYKYPIVIIDEFQDIDYAQYDIIKKIKPYTLIIFGDTEQTIHIWRGADLNRSDDLIKYFGLSNEKIFELTTFHRFKDLPPIESHNLNHSLDDPQGFATCKKTVKINCKQIALEAIKKNKILAILCRSNEEANDIVKFLRLDEDIFNKGIYAVRLGAENSPYEKAREIAIRLLKKEESDMFSYISVDIFEEIFPDSFEIVTVKSIKSDKKHRYQKSKSILDQLTKSYPFALKELVLAILEAEANRNWKFDKDIVNCLKFVVKSLLKDSNKWNDLTNEEKRILIDNTIIQYENMRLSNLPRQLISVMTIHQSKSREFDWIIIPWYSSKSWINFHHSNYYNCSKNEDKNLIHTARTRAKELVFVLKTVNYLPIDDFL